MPPSAKSERAEIYKDHDVQVFLSKFLSGEITELKPVYEPKRGYRYPLVETIVGEPAKVDAFLNRLFLAQILDRRLYEKVVYCPKCYSPNVSVHYCCPYCKSFNIQKSALIEHVKCGYMDVEENFHKNGKLVCPKCHEELKKLDVDFRRAGIWCTCKECEKSFDIPITMHFCRECQGNFSFEDIEIKDVYSYSLKSQAKEEAALGWVLMTPIREFLLEEGFKVGSPALMMGKSGANHLFDIVALEEKSKKATVIDLALSTQDTVSEQPVIALFAKIFDVSPEKAYLIAIPRMNDNAKKMAELYGIKVIEAKSQKEATKALKEKIGKN